VAENAKRSRLRNRRLFTCSGPGGTVTVGDMTMRVTRWRVLRQPLPAQAAFPTELPGPAESSITFEAQWRPGAWDAIQRMLHGEQPPPPPAA
jgi:hypothetical protein